MTRAGQAGLSTKEALIVLDTRVGDARGNFDTNNTTPPYQFYLANWLPYIGATANNDILKKGFASYPAALQLAASGNGRTYVGNSNVPMEPSSSRSTSLTKITSPKKNSRHITVF